MLSMAMSIGYDGNTRARQAREKLKSLASLMLMACLNSS